MPAKPASFHPEALWRRSKSCTTTPRVFPPSLPSSSLTWGPCTDAGLEPDSTFLCATAEVPLDYRRPTWRNISLALIKSPATGETSKRLGSVFFNPGGPGGSGIEELPDFVDSLPAAVTEVGGRPTCDPHHLHTFMHVVALLKPCGFQLAVGKVKHIYGAWERFMSSAAPARACVA